MIEANEKIQFIKDTLSTRQDYHKIISNHSFTSSEKDILLQATVNIMHSSPDKFLIYEAYEILAAKSLEESTSNNASIKVRINIPKPKNKLVENEMSRGKTLGFVGSIILFIGVFMPIIHIPIVGDMNYFQNGKGDGVFILVFAAVSFFLVVLGKFKILWFTALASLTVMLFTLYNFSSKLSQVKSEMKSDLDDNPFRGFADAAIQSVQLQWGWAVLFVGIGLLIVSAVLPEKDLR